MTSSEIVQNELVRRRELDVVEHRVRGATRWTIREPWASATFQLNEHEYFILNQLHGDWTIADVCAAFEKRFAPLRLTPQKLFRYLHVLHREGLVVSRHESQANVLQERSSRQRVRQRWATLANPLAIRLPGMDLSRPLEVLAKIVRPMFRPAVAGLLAVVGGVTLLMAIVMRDQWMPEAVSLGDGRLVASGLLLLLAIGGTKVLHELGHAVTLHLLGGRCRDMGIMFLVFAPCLYCDVSDAWLFPSKWKRIAVSLAGIVVELLLAALAFWIWWLTPVGPVHDVSLMVMLVCSANTLLLNGNPLMRYDGYYVLSDLSERPNLAEHSRAQLRRFVLGENHVGSGRLDRFAATYGLCSILYRLFIFSVIFVALYRVAEPYRLEILVMLLACWTLLGSLAMSLRQRPQKWALTGACVVAVAIAVLFVPLPASVQTLGVVRPARMVTLEATKSGWIREPRRYGDKVDSDAVVLRIESTELEKEIAALEADRRRQTEIVETLEAQAIVTDEVAAELLAAQEQATQIGRQLTLKQAERDELTLHATIDGVLLPPDTLTDSRHSTDGLSSVASLSGARRTSGGGHLPLDRIRESGYVRRGEVIARVGTSGKSEALLLIPEDERSRVSSDMTVEVRMRMDPHRPLHGKVSEIAELSGDLRSRFALALPDQGRGPGQVEPLYYVARVTLNNRAPDSLLFGTAKARFKLPSRSLAQRIQRWWSNTFYFGK